MSYAGIVAYFDRQKEVVSMVSPDVPSPEVPDEIAIVRDFVNTTDHETGTDDLTTTAQLTSYLVSAKLLDRRSPATAADLELAHTLRLGLRRALELNHDATSAQIPELEAALAQLPFELRWVSNAAVLVPVSVGVRGGLTKIAIAMSEAMSADRWWRLKVCLSDDCEWAFYDKSKNRSARWCEYGCGDKIKMRAYRARQKAQAP